MIKSWSYSRLIDYEQCPYKAKLKYVERIPEERSEAADRGTEIHTKAEDFVQGKLSKLPPELAKFSDEFLSLRTRYDQGQVSLEGEWGFDRDWNPCDYKTAWARIKLDARVHLSPTHSLVIDYKTGKRYGNELKHGEQTLLYGIAEALREPTAQKIDTELWYLDKDEIAQTTMTRTQVLKYLPQFEKRALKMTTATEFPASPNVFSCKFCPYGPTKGKQCEFGVAPGDTAIKQYRRRFG